MFNFHTTPEAQISPLPNGWHLEIPAGKAGLYRVAQIDDYSDRPRKLFPLTTPITLSLRCRTSDSLLPGTWGFGFWNDPFALGLGLQGMARRLPALPNACWFFHASAENHLSFDNSQLGSGFLAQTFRSPQIPSALLAPGLLAVPLLFSQTIAKWLRAVSGKIIRQDGVRLNIDVTQWHAYNLTWRESEVAFSVDDALVFKSALSPQGPLGLVVWIDNQYAAWTPQGRIGLGTLQQESAGWMEIEGLEIVK